MTLSVKLDLSFIEDILSYLKNLDPEGLKAITLHEAANGVYRHARRFRNTDKDITGFWTQILSESNKNQDFENVYGCYKYIIENHGRFSEAYRELEHYLPIGHFHSTLYAMIGYDIGIVFDGNAFLNLGHPTFGNKNELVYFAMHELHHAVYTQIHPLYSLDELETTDDLARIIKYSTHLEGLAVYCSYSMRKRENQFTHYDYVTLNDPEKTQETVDRFYKILSRVENESSRALVDEDYSILDVMSGGERLWYVTGAYMAGLIDEMLGRDALNETIIKGPDSFFKNYKSCLKIQNSGRYYY